MNVVGVMMYSDRLLSYFYSPRHVGEWEQSEDVRPYHLKTLRAGCLGSDRVQFQLLVSDHKIVDICYKAYGGVVLIALGEWVCRMLKGVDLKAAEQLTVSYMIEQLTLPRTKRHVALLVESALQKMYIPKLLEETGL